MGGTWLVGFGPALIIRVKVSGQGQDTRGTLRIRFPSGKAVWQVSKCGMTRMSLGCGIWVDGDGPLGLPGCASP